MKAILLQKLFKSKLPPRGNPKTPEYYLLVNKRHAAILGLSSLILAFPYEVPEWMPQILVVLAKCSSDPSPILNTIQHTFREFKRTHQDSWEEHSLKFTEDELLIISELLISPGYYA